MVNGEEDLVVGAGRYTAAQLGAIEAMGIEVAALPSGRLELTLSQSVAFFNPPVLPTVGLGSMLSGPANEPGYKNDEQIDDSLRCVLFEFPAAGSTTITGVVDLGAIDVQQCRDHGIPYYNDLRAVLGLPRAKTFTDITGEATETLSAKFGADPINSPAILAFTSLRDLHHRHIAPSDTTTRAVYATRASTLAARLKGIYGTVDKVDAFVGMVSEPHVEGRSSASFS